jgi:hypothetical protein
MCIPDPRSRLFSSRIRITDQCTVYLWIKEGDEGEGPEGLRYEDVRDLPELGEVLLEVLTRHLLRAPAHEHLAGHLLHLNKDQS